MRVGHHVLLVIAVCAAAGAGRAADLAASQAPPPGPTPTVTSEAAATPLVGGASQAPGTVAELRAEPAWGYRSNVWVPLLEAGVMVAGLNLVDRQVLGHEWARTDPETASRNLGNWQLDGDPFEMNNLMHPYTGSLYYAAARSMGLAMWWSFGVASLGSAAWEIGGETQPASVNDQIMTSVGGSFLGEVLYRSAVLILCGGDGAPGFWREGAALLVSPPTGANRLMFGDRYRTIDFDRQPVTYLEASAGVAFDRAPGSEGGSAAPAALLGLRLIYGLPGEHGWPVRHPFDHFDLQLGLRSGERESPFAALFIRGMLAGSRIEGSWSGIWGLAGLFDYATPGPFHVSTAALGAATTGQLGARGGVALQGTAVLGAGFGTGGAAFAPADGPGNHRGPAAQLVLESRLLLGSRGAIGAGLRQYLIARAGAASGLEAQSHFTLSGRLRIAGRHAMGVEWMDARRWSRDPGSPATGQRASELSVSYVLLTDRAFGARPRHRRPAGPVRPGPARRLGNCRASPASRPPASRE